MGYIGECIGPNNNKIKTQKKLVVIIVVVQRALETYKIKRQSTSTAHIFFN